MSKKLIFFGLVLLLIVVPAFGGATNNELKVNVMVLPGTTGLSLVKMLEEEHSLGPGVVTEYTVVSSAEKMVAKVISGEAQIAALPTNTAAILYNKEIPIKLGAITNWGVMYLVGRDPSIKNWQDLKGKSIGTTAKGATPDILLRYLLTVNGIDPERDVSINYYPTPVELAQLTIAEKTSLAVLPEPWVTEALHKNSSYQILLDFQEEWKEREGRRESTAMSCIIIQAQLVTEHPEIVTAFLEKAAAASRWVNKFPNLAAGPAQKHLRISAAAVRDAIPRCNLRFATASDAQEEIDYYLRKLYGYDPKSIGGRIPDADFYLQQPKK